MSSVVKTLHLYGRIKCPLGRLVPVTSIICLNENENENDGLASVHWN